MVWKEDMDYTMLQEMAAEGVLHHKGKSRNREYHGKRLSKNSMLCQASM
jgi:hypothetical protein